MTRTRRSLPFQTAALVALLGLSSSGCALLVGGAVAGGAAGGAASVEESDEHHSPMTYVGSVLASAVYFPAKVVLAVGGAAWAVPTPRGRSGTRASRATTSSRRA